MSDSEHNGGRHLRETPDVSDIKNVDVSHEVSDVNIGAILTFVGLLTAMTIVIYVGMYLLFRHYNSTEESREPKPGPMAMTGPERLPPEPRLQVAPGYGLKLEKGQWISLEQREPQAEYLELRKQWEQTLKEGLKDPSGNVVGLPIDEAIQRVVAGGILPSKAPAGSSTNLDDYGISMPTAASSGRVSQKLR